MEICGAGGGALAIRSGAIGCRAGTIEWFGQSVATFRP